jgi:predicted peptidase
MRCFCGGQEYLILCVAIHYISYFPSMKEHKSRSRFILAALGLSLFTMSCATKEKTPSEEELLRVPFISTLDQQEHEYFLYLPRGYRDDPAKKWPVMMFLHGNGERGNGKDELDYVLIHGPLYEAWIQRRDLPFIIISPQLPMFGMDTLGFDYLTNRNPDIIPKRLPSGAPEREPASRMSQPMAGAEPVDSLPYVTLPRGWDQIEDDLMNMIDHVLTNYQGDAGRVYLTGLSYGGFGTWYIASKHPDVFAAISPIVGWGHPDLMPPIAEAKLPVWAFSGGRDSVVPKKYFLAGLNKLEALGHPEVRYTIEEDMGHDTWRRVYGGEDLYQWFLKHSR